MTLNITEPTVGASSGTWGTQLNDALTAIVAYVNTVESNAQPVDSDLTAIAALTTTAYGRSLLTQANAAAAQTVLGLGTAATQASSAFDAAGAAATAQATALSGAATDATAKANAAAAASQPLDSDLTAIAALTTTTFGRSFLDRADATAARTLLGLGSAATLAVGTTTGTVAAGDDTRITGAVPNTRTVNGKALSANVTLTASDVGAQPAGNYMAASPAPSAWQASHAYSVGQTFTQAGTTYVVATAYTSGGSFGSTDTSNAFSMGTSVTVGTTAGTVAAGDDARITGAATKPASLLKTANYTLLAADAGGAVIFNGASLTATLPSAVTVGVTSFPFTVKNQSATTLTLASTAGTIDGATTRSLAQYDAVSVVSDGTNWNVI